MKTKLFTIIFLLFISLTIYSQIDKPTNVKEELQNKKEEKDSVQTTQEKEKSYFEVKTSYTNNYNFNGRVNITPVPFISTYLGYFNKSGFSISTSLFYSLLVALRVSIQGTNFQIQNVNYTLDPCRLTLL